ncbi:MAG: hypothetical protein ACOYBR_09610 [Fluviibacter sp.]
MAAHLISMTGYARSGKDTAARAIKAIERRAVVRAFADAVRAECAEAFALPVAAFTSDEYKDIPFIECAIGRCKHGRFINTMLDHGQALAQHRTPREIMQLWGTEYRRALDGPDYWITRLFDWFDEHASAAPVWLVPDVRFPSEAAGVLNRAGEVWRIVRVGVDRRSTHTSEAYIPFIMPTRIVHNDGTADELGAKVQRIYAEARDARKRKR